MAQSVIHRTLTVAAGAFAPGHLGELTRIVPFEMVDAALESGRAVQARVRVLPSRVVVYLLLAAGLFTDIGYTRVWAKLTAGLEGLALAYPGSSALAQARRRIGAAPLRELFGLLAGPAAGAARWRGLLVCAIDGTSMFVPDTDANLGMYHRCNRTHLGCARPPGTFDTAATTSVVTPTACVVGTSCARSRCSRRPDDHATLASRCTIASTPSATLRPTPTTGLATASAVPAAVVVVLTPARSAPSPAPATIRAAKDGTFRTCIVLDHHSPTTSLPFIDNLDLHLSAARQLALGR
jgi:hypothetical protein